MKSAAFKSIESSAKTLVLILDKVGIIGNELAGELSKDFFIVLVSKRIPENQNKKVFFIPFKNKIPKVPNALYSKIYIIDDGENSIRESVSSFAKRAKQTNAQLYLITSIRQVDVNQADDLISFYSRSKVLVLGDLFDSKVFFDPKSSISRFIYQARKNKKIYIEGDGLGLSYPMLFKDTIKLILKATFIDVSQKVILLFNQYPITDISLAHLFQKIDPDITSDFVESRGERRITFPKGAQFALSKYDLKKKISEIDLNIQNKKEIKIDIKKKKYKTKFLKQIFFFFLACIFLLSLPLMMTTLYSYLGIRQIEGARISAEEGNFKEALAKSKNAKTFFSVAKKTSIPLEMQGEIIGKENYVGKINSRIATGEDLSNASYSIFLAAENLKKVYEGKSIDSKKDFYEAQASFKNAYSIIQKVRAQGQIPTELERKIDDALPLIEFFSNSSEVLPNILGFDKEQKYLILFQNNNELRPGGGAVGAVGIITLVNGRTTDFEVQDVKELDNRLKIHVEPPYPIRRHLFTRNLHLKDANFDPDFVNSAISVTSIYKLETKQDVDGVIGVDLYFLKQMLKTVGVVYVPGYGKVNKNNFEAYAQSSENFIPLFIKEFESKLGNDKNIKLISIAEAIGSSISEKHILIAVKNQDAQNIFDANGFSGSLKDSRSLGPINDYFGISEANLGKNKINNLISRSISRKLIIDESGGLDSIATISFKNSNSKGSGGEYKNYLQLILPKGSKIQDVSVGGKKISTIPAGTNYLIYEAKGYRKPTELEIEQRIESDKSIFGFLISVPEESVKTVKVTYSLPFKIGKTTRPIDYSLLVYKQPGIDSFPFEQIFEETSGISILPASALSEEINSDSEFNFTINQR